MRTAPVFTCGRARRSSRLLALPRLGVLLLRAPSAPLILRAATLISSAHGRFSLTDESFDKHRSLLTCGRALAAAWRPRWRRWRSSRQPQAAALLLCEASANAFDHRSTFPVTFIP